MPTASILTRFTRAPPIVVRSDEPLRELRTPGVRPRRANHLQTSSLGGVHRRQRDNYDPFHAKGVRMGKTFGSLSRHAHAFAPAVLTSMTAARLAMVGIARRAQEICARSGKLKRQTIILKRPIGLAANVS